MYKFFKIVIPIFLVAVLFCCSILPASAAGLESVEFFNYAEYETSYFIDGDNDIVYVDLPLNWFYYRVYNWDNTYQKSGYWTAGTTQTFYIQNGGATYFEFFPFGTPFDLSFPGGSSVSGNFLDLNQLPEDSMFYYVMDYTGYWQNGWMDMTIDSLSTTIYVDEFGNVVADYDNDVGVATYTFSEYETVAFTNTFQKVGGAKGVAFGHRPFTVTFDRYDAAANASFSLHLSKVQLILSIPSLFRMREDTEITNGLLKDILDSLDQIGETNNKLDNVINGDISPIAPGGSNDISDALQDEDALLSDAISNWGSSNDIFANVGEIVLRYGAAFRGVSLFLVEFIDIPYISSLLYFGLALGIVSVILNIVHMAVSHSRSDAKGKSKGG